MTNKKGPDHVVVDGSNIATEGRSMPSLTQLNEAVMNFMDEHPDTSITVVVDATFGHRIDKKEVKEFEAGISNNELVAPPAGAVGRGDAFVLGIADKANASVLSNDSFQEFHGEYEWLFDEGRLIGGKPVPHVGWVWVDRVPVRGPISRKATGSSRRDRSSSRSGSKSSSGRGSKSRTGSKEASEPMPVPKGPPPASKKAASDDSSQDASTHGASRQDSSKRDSSKASSRDDAAVSKSKGGDESARRPAPKGQEPVNDLMPFLEFVEHHPVGTSVIGTVDAYSSHGAYVTIGDSDVRGYIPLRLMAEPAPRSAKKVMKIGDSVTLVVVSFAAARRSIDCAVPDLAEQAIAAAAEESGEGDEPDDAEPTRKKAATRKSVARKSGPKRAATKKSAAANSGAEQTDGRPESHGKEPTQKKTATKKTAAKKSAAKQSAAKKTAAKKSAKKTATKKTATKKTATKKSATKKTVAKKSAAKKSATKKAAGQKSATKKSATKKTATRKRAAKKTAAAPPAAEKES